MQDIGAGHACQHTACLSPPADAVCQCICRSLCLIDEFGKGTLCHDGFGLFCATLSHFVRCPGPPRVLACTHFTEILRFQSLTR